MSVPGAGRPPATTAGSEPWRVEDLVATGSLLAVALALLVAGWYGAGGHPSFHDQIPWLDVGVGGVIVSALAAAQWIAIGRRSVGRRLARVAALQLEVPAGEGASVLPGNGQAGAGTPGPGADHRLVSAPAGSYYHRPECVFVRGGADLVDADAGHHLRAGRTPCPACRP